MAKAKMILVPSTRMDNNKKKDRNENMLVRMSAVARRNLGFEDKVELWPQTSDTAKKMRCAMLLDIFQAFSGDIKQLRAEGFTPEELRRVGFVTTKTYNRITGGSSQKVHKSIWISDKIDETVIGCDPEFLLFDSSGSVVRANNVLSYNGMLGCDGAMAEVRPKPAMSPEELVANIRAIFADPSVTDPISALNWMSGCYYVDSRRDYPMGGHIHIGNPTRIAKMRLEDRENFFKVFNKILDELLALPMIKIDGAKLGAARRTTCSMGKFGYFGEYRLCNGRLEHRTLSGLWLMHPKLATCVFGTAKAIIDAVFKCVADNGYSKAYTFPAKFKGTGKQIWQSSFNSWADFPLAADMGCVESSAKMNELLNTSSATRINAKFLAGWYKRMRALPTYKKYARYIDGLYEILKFKVKHFEDFEKKIQTNWLEGNRFIGE